VCFPDVATAAQNLSTLSVVATDVTDVATGVQNLSKLYVVATDVPSYFATGGHTSCKSRDVYILLV
jgi:hypothetical protein